MKDHTPGYTPRTCVSDRQKRLSGLSAELEASADRICDYQDRLMAGITALKPIEYDRLLDEYRAELVRYDNIDRELRQLEGRRGANPVCRCRCRGDGQSTAR